jgi:hypothetical protein
MRIIIALSALTSLFLFSCQKEADFANGNSGGNGGNTGNPSDELLVKTVQKIASDSLVTTYGYNANKKLISLKQVGIDDQGDFVDREYHYHRTASGIITDYSIIDAELLAAGIDSVRTIVHYNSSTSRYTSYVLKIDILGFSLLDSSVFVYDGSGKIVGENVYESPSGSGNDYYLSGKLNYSYSANGNISQLDIRDLDLSGTEIFSAITKISYDTKINPLHFNNEALAMGHPEWISGNNIANEQLSDSNGPADDQTVTITYTYNAGNKPKTSVTTVMPDNITVNTSFYYQ